MTDYLNRFFKIQVESLYDASQEVDEDVRFSIESMWRRAHETRRSNVNSDRKTEPHVTDILIRNEQNVNVYTSNKDFFSTFGQMNEMTSRFEKETGQTIEENSKFVIKRMKDNKNGISYILLSSKLDNGYLLYIRIPVTSIQESVKISNNFLY